MLAEAALALHRHSSRLSSTIRKHPSIVTITAARPFFALAPRKSPDSRDKVFRGDHSFGPGSSRRESRSWSGRIFEQRQVGNDNQCTMSKCNIA